MTTPLIGDLYHFVWEYSVTTIGSLRASSPGRSGGVRVTARLIQEFTWYNSYHSLPADVLWGSFVTHSFRTRDEQTPKEVCGEPTHTREAHCIYYATRVWEELLWQQETADVVTQKLYLVDSPYIDLLSEETPCSLTQLHASHNWISAF